MGGFKENESGSEVSPASEAGDESEGAVEASVETVEPFVEVVEKDQSEPEQDSDAKRVPTVEDQGPAEDDPEEEVRYLEGITRQVAKDEVYNPPRAMLEKVLRLQ
jgi:hypothetical protein